MSFANERRRPDLAVRDGAEQLNFWPDEYTRPSPPEQMPRPVKAPKAEEDLAAPEPLTRAISIPASAAMRRAWRVVDDMRKRGVSDQRIAQALRATPGQAATYGLELPAMDWRPAWRRP